MRDSVREIERRLEANEPGFSIVDARWHAKLIFMDLIREGDLSFDEVRAESNEALTRFREIIENRVKQASIRKMHRIYDHEHLIAAPATKELRFAKRLLETATEAQSVWAERPPVGERACRMTGDHCAIWLAKSIEYLLKFEPARS